ncbi:hypothetical protein [Baekduia soli]|nr:hypothetical protein [Baekduia soli]
MRCRRALALAAPPITLDRLVTDRDLEALEHHYRLRPAAGPVRLHGPGP